MRNAPSSLDLLLNALKNQALSCRSLGSPFTASLCETLADFLSASSSSGLSQGTPACVLLERLENWPGDPSTAHDSVPLRLTGALHSLVRTGAAPELAAHFPPTKLLNTSALAEAAAATFVSHAAFIDDWLNSAPQTNEVGRSAVLGAGLAALESSHPGMSWRVLELGASGGLNLIADCYALHLSGQVLGDASASVALEPEWRGTHLHASARLPKITARLGCDLNPLNLLQKDVRERLLAYIWADQSHRLERTQAAIKIAAEMQSRIDAVSAQTFLADRLLEHDSPTVVMHSVAWQYFPPEVKASCRALIQQAAHRATVQAPLAWLGMETDGTKGSAGLRLKIWPQHAEDGASRLLARVDYHGRWIEWLDTHERQRIDPGGS